MASELTRRDRAQALARLDELADEMALICNWLSSGDEDRAAITLECAVRDARATAWLLAVPVLRRAEGPAAHVQTPGMGSIVPSPQSADQQR